MIGNHYLNNFMTTTATVTTMITFGTECHGGGNDDGTWCNIDGGNGISNVDRDSVGDNHNIINYGIVWSIFESNWKLVWDYKRINFVAYYSLTHLLIYTQLILHKNLIFIFQVRKY